MSVPNPAILARQAEQRRLAAEVAPSDKAKLMRPGTAEVEVPYVHDGVVKTKHLEPGMVVRPFVHGQPRGSERTVKGRTKVDNGAFHDVEFESAHPGQQYKAAYRWYCEALDGMPTSRTVRKPALVPYEEV